MAAQTESQLNTLYADNTTGDISPADLRLFVDTLFQNRTFKAHAHRFTATTGAGRPSPGVIGTINYLQFAIGDSAYFHITLPQAVDPDRDVDIVVDWAPAAAESGKLVSWDLAYLVYDDATGTIDTVDDTLQVVDVAVPTTQWKGKSSTFTIPASAFVAADNEIHLKLTRVAATSNDPVTDPVVHHVHGDIPIKWPGAD